MGKQFVALLDALLILAHVQIHAGKEGGGGVQAHISLVVALDALALAVREILLGLEEVVDDGVVHLTHGGTLGGGDVQVLAQHHARVVTALRIRHREEVHELEVQEGTEEVVLTEQMVAQGRCARDDGVDVGIRSVDDLVADPPGVVDVLVGGILAVHVGLGERVLGLTGNRHVVSPELSELEVMADVVVSALTAALALVGDTILEQGVNAIGGVDRRGRVLGQLGGGHGIRRIEVHVARRQGEGRKYDCYDGNYLFHNSCTLDYLTMQTATRLLSGVAEASRSPPLEEQEILSAEIPAFRSISATVSARFWDSSLLISEVPVAVSA